MAAKKITGFVLIVLGLLSFFFGNYISNQVREGNRKIEKSQKTVDQVQKVSRVNPYSKAVGDIATKSIQKKIDEGKDEVQQYSTLAKWLRIGGYISFALGVFFLIWGFLQKKST